MRVRRSFQPMLDTMPYRIAPSAGVAIAASVTVNSTVSVNACVSAMDTDPPDSGGSGPIIIAPVTPPTTLVA
jgi:hypothetical protein